MLTKLPEAWIINMDLEEVLVFLANLAFDVPNLQIQSLTKNNYVEKNRLCFIEKKENYIYL